MGLLGSADMTRMLDQRVSVQFTYPVVFTSDLFDPANPVLADMIAPGARVLPVFDDGVVAAQPQLAAQLAAYAAAHERIGPVGEPVVLPGGEAVKNDARHVDAVLDAINAHHIDRHAYVLVVGGGSVIDTAGYAAAIAHRGVRLIRVPTTVLAQNDAAVGVKNGVNAFQKKNFLGTFAPPAAVLCDRTFLDLLDDRQWRAGTSEAVKVALLRDAAFFDWLEAEANALRERDRDAMWHLVQRCAELHLEHITAGGDPFELGSSRPLDFGHWAAHRLERLTDFRVVHGEAVAIGIALDCIYARRVGHLDAATCARITGTLERLGLPITHEQVRPPASGDHPLLTGLQEFREHLGGRLTITLVTAPGAPIDVHEIDEAEMLAATIELAGTAERVDA